MVTQYTTKNEFWLHPADLVAAGLLEKHVLLLFNLCCWPWLQGKGSLLICIWWGHDSWINQQPRECKKCVKGLRQVTNASIWIKHDKEQKIGHSMEHAMMATDKSPSWMKNETSNPG